MALFPRFVSQLSLQQACKITNFKRRKYLILLAMSEASGDCSKLEYHDREPGLEESGPLLWPQSKEKGKTSLSTVFKTITLSWLSPSRLYLLQHQGPLGNIQDPNVNRTLALLLFLKTHLLGSLVKVLCVCLLFYLFCSHIYNTFYLTFNCWFLFLILFIDLDVWLVDV